MEKFDKLWEQRDVLYLMKEDKIDKLVMPISNGLRLRYFCEGVGSDFYKSTDLNKVKIWNGAIKTGLNRLFQHLQVCCMDCYEPTPSRIVEYDENGVPLSVEVDEKFKCGDMMGFMHFDHEEVPESGYLPPAQLASRNKDVAKCQIECTNMRCAG